MASIKNLKKDFNYAIFDIVEEAYSQQLWDESKTANTEAVIEETIQFRNDTVAKINAANSKAEYRAIRKEIADNVEVLATKLM